MSEERIAYEELQPGTEVQAGDQYRNTQGRWVEYSMDTSGVPIVGPTTMARRPIRTTHQTTYEEVPGSRTTQDAVSQPQRERIAYEELQPGDIIQEGDEWQNECGRWRPFLVLDGSRVQVRQSQRVRRPYNITQLQDERDEARNERDLARSEVARLSTELWARKPLEDRVLSLTEELAQAREASQQLLKTIAENADQFAEHTASLVHERDEARAERDRLQEVVGNLYNEPTARQVEDMLRTWATELDWSADCFDSVGRERINDVQRTLIAVMERIETIIHPEGNTNGE